MENIICNVAHPDNLHGNKGAELVFKPLKENIYGIKTIYADGGCRGNLKQLAQRVYGYRLKISPKIKNYTSGKLSPKKRATERIFS